MGIFDNEVSVTTKPSSGQFRPPTVEQQQQLATALTDFGTVVRRVQYVESSFKKPINNEAKEVGRDLIINIGRNLSPENLPYNAGMKVTPDNAEAITAAFSAAAEEGRRLKAQQKAMGRDDDEAIKQRMTETLGDRLNPLLQNKPAASR